ncbi:DUF2163 domain-containing protein [Roseobacter denitrificans]|uniref:Bacteriophage phiJL001 Gp84 C-terminal domain-containing protein n=1 Tax=Roseobacter denitrificans (strain ATCC 33942 / OCh 114) TaxID=375451 RepID=Q164Q9_ROSDO|nr:DUF2163 domain-containing protein [Roseobacter denitrificans]ABG32534.1 conserved hypothetical protein [Roseobacter denitrificans OCh 114]AVL51981.1 DUF2163 domain-containing protein [Roseobacter denitrificans]SFF83188.1 phage conserved hypothetical protein BR0599 [Roseobacter denitrificans OCh 114]
MTGMNEGLKAHLATGLTTLAHAWAIERTDGVILGFTDHDRDLRFEGITFRADTGLSALALSQSTGLSVDNTEAIGALNDLSIREDEIEQGRFDGAEVRAWLVNWTDVDQRWLQFRGTIGELRRTDGGFQAELRGLTESLNRPLGRVFQKPCTAVLGDQECGFDTSAPGYSIDLALETIDRARIFQWVGFNGFEANWFTRGRLEVLDGPAAGLWGMVKHDRLDGNTRTIELWEPIRAPITPGTQVRISAGCDKRSETCRLKFSNLANFRGFPDLPGDDWLMAVPKKSGANRGGSLR